MSKDKQLEGQYQVRIVRIKKGISKPALKLSHDFELPQEAMKQQLLNLPFTFPKTFASLNDARHFSQEYSQLGCILEFVKHEGPAGNQRYKQQLNDQAKQEVDPDNGLNRPLLWVLSILIILVLSGLWTLFQPGINTRFEQFIMLFHQSELPAPMKRQDIAVFSGKQQGVIKQLDLQQPQTQLVESVENSSLSDSEKQQVDETYQQWADEQLEDAVKFLQISIAFNKRNENAWQQLIKLYEMRGDTAKAMQTRRDMAEYFD